MKKILLLTDFSEAFRNTLQFTRSFFSDTVANFHLLYIQPVEPNGPDSLTHVSEKASTTHTAHLQDMVTRLRQEATNDWHTFRSSACQGNPYEIVGQVVQAEMYDFVVIGPQQDGSNELFSNSAIDLIRHLKANALVIPVDAPVRSVRQVVLAADFANLKNAKLLSPIKELVTLKGAYLTLLTVDTPGKDVIHVEQEAHIRQFLSPIDPLIARLEAPDARQGIDAYLAGHLVDLLVTIPHHNGWTDALAGRSVTRSLAYAPPVPLLTLYDDGSMDLPRLIDELTNLTYAH